MNRNVLMICASLLLSAACDDKQVGPATPQVPAQPSAPAEAEGLQSPADVVAAYYTAIWDMELEKGYHLVSAGDRAVKPLDDFQRSVAGANERFAGAKRGFAVHETIIEGDTARVQVDITAPDISRIHEQVMRDLAGPQGPPDAAKLASEIERRVTDPAAPRATKRHEVLLVQEDGMWRLDFDWDRPRDDRAIPERVKPPAPPAK